MWVKYQYDKVSVWLRVFVLFIFSQGTKYPFANMFFNRITINLIKYMIIPNGKRQTDYITY